MTSAKTKRRFYRRERRKAKASGWSRAPKNPKRHAHGCTLSSVGHFVQASTKRKRKLVAERQPSSLTAGLPIPMSLYEGLPPGDLSVDAGEGDVAAADHWSGESGKP